MAVSNRSLNTQEISCLLRRTTRIASLFLACDVVRRLLHGTVGSHVGQYKDILQSETFGENAELIIQQPSRCEIVHLRFTQCQFANSQKIFTIIDMRCKKEFSCVAPFNGIQKCCLVIFQQSNRFSARLTNLQPHDCDQGHCSNPKWRLVCNAPMDYLILRTIFPIEDDTPSLYVVTVRDSPSKLARNFSLPSPPVEALEIYCPFLGNARAQLSCCKLRPVRPNPALRC